MTESKTTPAPFIPSPDKALSEIAAAKAMLACLEGIRASHPELIADHAPKGWGMNRFRSATTEASVQASEILDEDDSLSDEEVVASANTLARDFYRIRGYVAREDYKFYQATHPHEVEAWQMAKHAFAYFRDTDVNDALDNLGIDYV